MPADSYLEVVKGLAGQIEAASSIEASKLPVGHYDKIVVSGMGGSSIAGALLQTYMTDSKVPVFLSRTYEIPDFVDRSTLVFIISYSGNTEETISSLRFAIRKGAAVVAISSGGKLLNKFQEQQLPYIKLPANLQPRASIAYQLIPMLRLLYKLKIISNPAGDIASTVASLKKFSYEDRAKNLAGKLIGKVPLIYASEKFYSVAYRWKTQFNENAKVHAFSSAFSELNHNELVGYTNLNASYYVIILEDENDHPRIKARMKLTREVISKKEVPSTLLVIKGDNLLTRIFSAIHIGDLASVYLAFLTNTDPEPVYLIEELKRKLEKVPFI
ncbi:bifunctional phosphoglucose/phosphomannose isomerase [Candidatus Woesearchaeota archaeon]|nr:bifunctional phosphoglucose/phosphomannose isomerase [Candidatus Woesearchaeota archaeon]